MDIYTYILLYKNSYNKGLGMYYEVLCDQAYNICCLNFFNEMIISIYSHEAQILFHWTDLYGC